MGFILAKLTRGNDWQSKQGCQPCPKMVLVFEITIAVLKVAENAHVGNQIDEKSGN